MEEKLKPRAIKKLESKVDAVVKEIDAMSAKYTAMEPQNLKEDVA